MSLAQLSCPWGKGLHLQPHPATAVLTLHSPTAWCTPVTLTPHPAQHTSHLPCSFPTLPLHPSTMVQAALGTHRSTCTRTCTPTPACTPTFTHSRRQPKHPAPCWLQAQALDSNPPPMLCARAALASWAARSCFRSSSFFSKTQVPRHFLAQPLKRE